MSTRRVDGRAPAECSHLPEPHVVYDRLAAGYRATVTCRCKEIDINAGRLHVTYDAAQDAALALLDLAKANRL